MRYFKCIKDGYIISIGKSESKVFDEITSDEYNQIKEIVANKPISDLETHGYRLRTDFSWEMYELPPVEESEEATEADYQSALRDMGVEV